MRILCDKMYARSVGWTAIWVGIVLLLFPCLLHAQRVEDWETGDFSSHSWSNESTHVELAWEIVGSDSHEGTFCAEASNYFSPGGVPIRMAVLYVTMDCAAGDISFYYKANSAPGQAWLEFYIDDVPVELADTLGVYEYASFPVTAGQHTFGWRVIEIFFNMAPFSAKVDSIQFPPDTSAVAPTVTQLDPTSGSTLFDSSVNIDVTFSEEVSGVDATDMVLSGGAATNASVGTATDQGSNTWRFPVSGLTTGALNISLAPDTDDIEDTSGNDLDPSPTQWSYTVTNGPPAVTQLDPTSGSTIPDTSININVTFSEEVSGVDGTDMVLSGGAATNARVGTATDQGNNIWGFPISGLTTGALNISLAPDADDIEDTSGNDLAPSPTQWSYTVTTLDPTVTQLYPTSGSSIWYVSSTNIDVTFSEEVFGVDSGDMVLSGSATSNAVVGAVTNLSSNTWRFPVSMLTDGTMNISLAPDANDIEDSSGNDLFPSPTVWSYTLRETPPVLINHRLSIGDTSTYIEVRFSEEVFEPNSLAMQLSGSAEGAARVGVPVDRGNNVWRFPLYNSLDDGTLNVSLGADPYNIRDMDVNDLDPSPTEWSYSVTIRPVVEGTSPPNGSILTAGSADIDVDFSEPVYDVDVTDMELGGAGSAGASVDSVAKQGSGNTSWRFSLSGLVDGGLTISLAPDYGDITDNNLNNLDPWPTVWGYSVVIPTEVLSQSPSPGTEISEANINIDVVFAEEVQGVDATDMVLSGSAASSAIVGTPTNLVSHTWRFPVSGLGDGTLNISLAPDADDIEDASGNDLDPQPTEWTYPVAIRPTVADQVPVPGSTISTDTVDIDVTFSESVDDVDATDMDLSGSAAGGASVGTPVDQGGNTWRFRVSGLSDGTLDISLAADTDDIVDASGNNLDPSPTIWSYTVAIPPRITNLDPASGTLLPGGGPGGPIDILVTFSEEVEFTTFNPVMSPQPMGGRSHLGNNVWQFSDVMLFEGSNTISLASEYIEDINGNNLDYTPWYYIVDATYPRVSEVLPSSGDEIGTTIVNIDITFTEPVTGVDASDMELSRDAASGASVGTPTDRGGNIWRFPVSGLSDGWLDIALAPDYNDITDLAGNSLWVVYLNYDVGIPPVILGRSPAPDATIPGESVNIDVLFSEPVQWVDASDMELSGTAAGVAVVGAPSDQGGNVWRFPVSGLSDGTLDITLAPDLNDIVDQAPFGNSLAPSSWGYSVVVHPSVTSQNPSPGATLIGSDTSIDVTFSESVTNVDATDMVLSGSASSNAIVGVPTDQGNDTWRFPVSGLDNGTLDISLAPDADDIVDASGNDLEPSPTTWSYTVNATAPPEVVSQSPPAGSTIEFAADWHSITVTFSEEVVGVDTTDMVLTGPASVGAVIRDVSESHTEHGWWFSFSFANEGTLNISLAPDANDIEDLDGHDLAPTGWTYNIIIPPIITEIVPEANAAVSEFSTNITVEFSEPVLGVDQTDLVLSGSAATGAAVGLPADLGNDTWSFPVTGLTNGALYVSIAPDPGDIQDSDGNDLFDSYNDLEWAYLVDPLLQWATSYSDFWDQFGFAVESVSDGGFVVLGDTYSYSEGAHNVRLLKTDRAGTELWKKTYGGASNDVGRSVQETLDGGFIICGFTESYGAGGGDAWLIRTDSAGNEVWSKTFGGADYDHAYSVRQTTNGGFIVVGQTSSFGTGSSDVWLIKTDSSGNEVWSKTFGGALPDSGMSAHQTSDGGFVIAGKTGSYGAGSWDVWLIKTDSSGNEVWSKTFGGTSSDSGESVQQTTDGGFIVVGHTASYGSGMSDGWLIKTDASGNESWNKKFGGAGEDYLSSVQQTADGGFILAGNTASYGAGGTDAWVILTDSSGNAIWQKTFGGNEDESGTCVNKTTDGGFVVSGHTESFARFPHDCDFWLLKIRPPVVLAYSPSPGSMLGATVDIDVTFSKEMVGIDATDMVLSGSAAGGASVGLPVDQGANTWRFPVSGLIDGNLDISLAPDPDDIEDAYGYDLYPSPVQWSYVVDTVTPPSVVSQNPASGSELPACSIRIDVLFSREVVGVDATDMVLSGTSASAAIVGTPTHLTGDTWRFPVSGLISGTLNISLAPDTDDIEDTNGNALFPRPAQWSYTVNIPYEWDSTFGGSEGDFATTVQQTGDGGYIIAGSTDTYGAGDRDFWLIKTDSSGNEVWNQTFGGTNYEWGSGLAQTPDGGFVLVGSTKSFGAGLNDAWLIKADSSGNELWNRTFGGVEEDYGYCVVETSDGSLLFAGRTESAGVGASDAWLVKTDSGGNELWRRTFGGASYDSVRSVQETSDGGFVLLGYTKSFGAGNYDAWLIKTDASGNETWSRTFGGGNMDFGSSVMQTTDGGFILAGYTMSFGAGNYDAWLIKTDASGNETWSRTFGGSDSDGAISILQTSDNGFTLGGYTRSFGAGISDIWLIRTDGSGNETWNLTLGGSEFEYCYSLGHTADGGMILVGYTQSYGEGLNDVWLIKFASEGDTDGDGIPDDQEGGNTPYIVGIDDRTVDSDLDGQSNADEYHAGTDPNSVTSCFKIITISSDADTALTWSSVTGRTYCVLTTTNLLPANWTEVTNPAYTNMPGTGTPLTYTNSESGAEQRFFRVRMKK